MLVKTPTGHQFEMPKNPGPMGHAMKGKPDNPEGYPVVDGVEGLEKYIDEHYKNGVPSPRHDPDVSDFENAMRTAIARLYHRVKVLEHRHDSLSYSICDYAPYGLVGEEDKPKKKWWQ